MDKSARFDYPSCDGFDLPLGDSEVAIGSWCAFVGVWTTPALAGLGRCSGGTCRLF